MGRMTEGCQDYPLHCPVMRFQARCFQKCPQPYPAPSAPLPCCPCLSARKSTACLHLWVQSVPEPHLLPPGPSGCSCPCLRGAANPRLAPAQWATGTAPYTAHCTLRKESQAADWREKTCCLSLLFSFCPFLCFTVSLCLNLRSLKVIFTTSIPFSRSSPCCLALLSLSVSHSGALCSVYVCVCVCVCVASLVLCLRSELNHTLRVNWMLSSLPRSPSLFLSHSLVLSLIITVIMWPSCGCQLAAAGS